MNFDIKAKSWDIDERISRAEKISEEIIRDLDLPKESKVMEFGCGTGLISFNYRDLFDNITLIDSSQGMIDVVNEKIEKFQTSNIKAFCMDFVKGERPVEKFDFIYNSMVLHHIQDTKAIVFDFYKRLNKKGIISIVDLDSEDGSFHSSEDFNGHKGFSQEELTNLLIETGFEIIESKSFYEITKHDKKYTLFVIKAIKF